MAVQVLASEARPVCGDRVARIRFPARPDAARIDHAFGYRLVAPGGVQFREDAGVVTASWAPRPEKKAERDLRYRAVEVTKDARHANTA
jgi:hypothetical protein